ncbi:hypothetical protein [Caenimonas koreensis]|uniref:hypothetical protein n=1 Tax=Caenimonas koreensis TaxID=367474 RepID=UPI003785003F
MSVYRLIGQFLRRHSAAYASSALMLAGIAVLSVWIPRQIGHVVDALVANPRRCGWASSCASACITACRCRGLPSSSKSAPAT